MKFQISYVLLALQVTHHNFLALRVFHFWQVDLGHELPLGLPNVMMVVTRDGQLFHEMIEESEKRFGVSVEGEKEARAYMTGPELGIHPLANGGGKGLKLESFVRVIRYIFQDFFV